MAKTLKTAAAIASKRKAFGYDAIKSRSDRPMVLKNVGYSEDRQLVSTDRAKLAELNREQTRNFTIAGWMIRKHLDYVASFKFHARTPDKAYNRELEAFVYELCRPSRFDVFGRHSCANAVRMFEAEKVVGGDVLFIKFKDGTVQGIPSDWIKQPKEYKKYPSVNTSGLVLEKSGKVKSYCVCTIDMDGKEMVNIYPATDCIYSGYFSRFDQMRGVSPLASALNTMRDLYSSYDYTLAKSKFHAMMGMAIFRDASDGTAFGDTEGNTTPADISVKPGMILDLNPTDRVEMLESKNPSNEFQTYSERMISLVMLALDIPITQFDGTKANYGTQRGDLIQYVKACQSKRENNQDALDQWTEWRLEKAAAQGKLPLPKGMTFDMLNWEWIPTGMPWLDPGAEASANQSQVGLATRSRQQICRERGDDFFAVCDQLAEEIEYAREKGVPLTTGMPGQITTEDNNNKEVIE